MTIDAEILGLVRHKHEVHDALARLFHSCAPHCTPDENTLHVINQLSNAIAGYRAALRSVVSHWDEFGPDDGMDETINSARKALYSKPGNAEPKPIRPAAPMLREAAAALATSEPLSMWQVHAARMVSDWLFRMADGEVVSHAQGASE